MHINTDQLKKHIASLSTIDVVTQAPRGIYAYGHTLILSRYTLSKSGAHRNTNVLRASAIDHTLAAELTSLDTLHSVLLTERWAREEAVYDHELQFRQLLGHPL